MWNLMLVKYLKHDQNLEAFKKEDIAKWEHAQDKHSTFIQEEARQKGQQEILGFSRNKVRKIKNLNWIMYGKVKSLRHQESLINRN